MCTCNPKSSPKDQIEIINKTRNPPLCIINEYPAPVEISEEEIDKFVEEVMREINACYNEQNKQ